MTLDIHGILVDRGKTHGDYKAMCMRIQQIKQIIHSADAEKVGGPHLTVTQMETLEMIAHKMGRILTGDPDFRDHWVDIAGYATKQAELCSK